MFFESVFIFFVIVGFIAVLLVHNKRSGINIYLFMINMWMLVIHAFFMNCIKSTYYGSRNSVQIMYLSHLALKR